jgi:hypothetical protein
MVWSISISLKARSSILLSLKSLQSTTKISFPVTPFIVSWLHHFAVCETDQRIAVEVGLMVWGGRHSILFTKADH